LLDDGAGGGVVKMEGGDAGAGCVLGHSGLWLDLSRW
jgi:hypothetical protein